jgi:hypothetical protein
MTEQSHPPHESPIDGAPVWVRALQAGAVGVAAGLALHLLLSMVVVQGRELRARPNAPAACKKSNPARETGGAGQRATPSVSVVPATAIVRG